MNIGLLIIFVIGIIGFTDISFAQEFPDPSSFRDLQKDETIPNIEAILIIESLGAILIAWFIVLYAIKKRIVKKNSSMPN